MALEQDSQPDLLTLDLAGPFNDLLMSSLIVVMMGLQCHWAEADRCLSADEEADLDLGSGPAIDNKIALVESWLPQCFSASLMPCKHTAALSARAASLFFACIETCVKQATT